MSSVTGALTTLPGGADSQAHCYDEQNRLVWASSATATGPCGASNTTGSLTSAAYTQTDSYDTLDRLTSGPVGAYTYGDSAHLHAVTSIGTGGTPTYTASYDAAGNTVCRAPTSATTCAGTPTGAQLLFDPRGAVGGVGEWRDHGQLSLRRGGQPRRAGGAPQRLLHDHHDLRGRWTGGTRQ